MLQCLFGGKCRPGSEAVNAQAHLRKLSSKYRRLPIKRCRIWFHNNNTPRLMQLSWILLEWGECILEKVAGQINLQNEPQKWGAFRLQMQSSSSRRWYKDLSFVMLPEYDKVCKKLMVSKLQITNCKTVKHLSYKWSGWPWYKYLSFIMLPEYD